MRRGQVIYNNDLAGVISETDDGEYLFKYDSKYIENHPSQFISFKMPVREEEYRSNILFPFFEGLIPEGWLLDIASKNWKINPKDRMGLLLSCCKNCIGAVSIEPISDTDEE